MSIVAVAIGVGAGAGAYCLLALAVKAILRGEPAAHATLPMLGNVAVIFATLLGTALLKKEALVSVGVGLAVGLIAPAAVQLIAGLIKGGNGGKGKGKS